MSNPSPDRTYLKLGIGALALAGLAAAFFAAVYFKKADERKRPAPDQLVIFKNLPENFLVDATLQNGSTVTTLVFRDGALLLPKDFKPPFRLPYKIGARLSDNARHDYDVVWSIDKNGVQYAVALDGFEPSDTATFSINGSTSLRDYPMDWSGRITLEAFMIKAETMTACVDIKTDQAPFSMCHVLTGKGGPT